MAWQTAVKFVTVKPPAAAAWTWSQPYLHSPQLATTPDTKHQSAPDQHGRSGDHGTRTAGGGLELGIRERQSQKDGEAAVPEPLVELRIDHEPVPPGDTGNRLRGRRA